jgi:hypothetical protein
VLSFLPRLLEPSPVSTLFLALLFHVVFFVGIWSYLAAVFTLPRVGAARLFFCVSCGQRIECLPTGARTWCRPKHCR